MSSTCLRHHIVKLTPSSVTAVSIYRATRLTRIVASRNMTCKTSTSLPYLLFGLADFAQGTGSNPASGVQLKSMLVSFVHVCLDGGRFLHGFSCTGPRIVQKLALLIHRWCMHSTRMARSAQEAVLGGSVTESPSRIL